MKRILVIVVMVVNPWLIADMIRFSVLAVDADNGTPVPKAEIKAWFKVDIGWNAWSEPTPIVTDSRITDALGRCDMRGHSNAGHVSCSVVKPPRGYYQSYVGALDFKTKAINGVWLPDNLVMTSSLQRIKTPIPLSVCRVRKRGIFNDGGIDATNAVLHYDFMVGDWLPPHGKGVCTDMVVRSRLSLAELVKRRGHLPPRQFFDFAHAVGFPGIGNGISPRIVPPTAGIKLRVAPDSGYEPSTVIHAGERKLVVGPNAFSEPYSESNENRCYFFRIRSMFNGKGELVKAYYGKIYDDFKFEGNAKTGLSGIDFFYYLNPTSLDRNLEWDMKNNLCQNPGELGMLRP